MIRKSTGGRKSSREGNRKADNSTNQTVVRNRNRKIRRLNLDKRVALKKNKEAK
ncbi:hypothetical protein SLEP1_g39996 [Rubroshorea leprosula]|uniref:Uncharacterized protein n=1 Tax=Rubroshorea leprosula TaxID=152421 RepID=A0AAV5L297_9ROSI|nr:hypothetical protein SLEP1_g39996 [Rubroshorea leprosula]